MSKKTGPSFERIAILFTFLFCFTPLFVWVAKHPKDVLHGNENCNKSNIGIDISHHQGVVNWSKVSSFEDDKIEFVYIKSTEGASFKDANYHSNVLSAHKKGFLVGSYHYFKTTSTAQNQFDNFIEHLDAKNQDLVPMIDIEERGRLSNERFHLTLSKFLMLIECYFDRKPLLYASNHFYKEYLRKDYKDYYFCIARYGGLKPDLPNWVMWQFTEKGELDGFSEYVDVNTLNDSITISILKLK